MIAGAGGAMRATGWRATAIRFQQFGEGGSAGCCARAASGHATAEPQSADMNCRLPISIAICPVATGDHAFWNVGHDITPQ
jgi:hypothetical protein